MGLRNLKNIASSISTNIGGKRIDRKIVVIESDDWGSIRMPSKEVFDKLTQSGIPVNNSSYCRYDGLETNSDVEELTMLIDRIYSKYDKRVLLTLNFVTANPNFLKIETSNLTKYYSESIEETYRNYSESDLVIQKVKKGLQSGVFLPQFHGREHVNVPFWMKLLNTNEDFRIAFNHKVFGLSNDVFPHLDKSVQATYDTLDTEYQNDSILEGLDNFEQIFGFRSKSFISNNYVLAESSFETLKNKGVEVIQGMKYQKLPIEYSSKRRKLIRRSYGEVDSNNNIKFSIRNCTFEPTEIGDTVERTLQQIRVSFLLKKPAVISTHRINFTSRMSTENRDKNLKEFEKLLSRIIEEWPEVLVLSPMEALEQCK